jgi:hypothetical protein
MKHTFIKLGIFGIVLALLVGCLQDQTTSMVKEVEDQVTDTLMGIAPQIVDTLPKVELTHEEVQSLALLDTSFTVSEEEASSTVLSIIQELEQQNSGIGMKTAFRKPRTIASIKPFRRHKESLGKSSSASPEDTSSELYLINFADEQGFAVTSADRRVANGGLLAFVPEGNLLEGDTVDNPGMALFAEGLEEYIEEEKELFRERVEHLEPAIEKIAETLPDSIKEILLDSNQVSLRKKAGWEVINADTNRTLLWGLYLLYTYKKESEYVTSIKRPLSTVAWAQGDGVYGGDPIDDDLTYENTGVSCGNNKRPLSGCVATATAQIMAKYKHPKSIPKTRVKSVGSRKWTVPVRATTVDNGKRTLIAGTALNWNAMTADTSSRSSRLGYTGKRHISKLFAWIGEKVEMNYGCGESGSKNYKAADFLERQGYKVGRNRGYNFEDVVSSVDNGRMVLIRGYTEKNRSCTLFYCWNNYSNGHSWLIDGYMTRWYNVTTGMKLWTRDKSRLLWSPASSKTYFYDHFVHMNWGWGPGSYYNRQAEKGETYNGYFKSGVFSAFSKPISHKNENANFEKSDNHSRHFKYNLEGSRQL